MFKSTGILWILLTHYQSYKTYLKGKIKIKEYEASDTELEIVYDLLLNNPLNIRIPLDYDQYGKIHLLHLMAR